MSLYKTLWTICDWNSRFDATYKDLTDTVSGKNTDYWGNLTGHPDFGNNVPKRPARIDDTDSDTTYTCYDYTYGGKTVVFKTLKGTLSKEVTVSSGGSVNVGAGDVVYGITVPSGGVLTVSGEAYDVFQDWGASVTEASGAIVTYIPFIDGVVISSGIIFELPEKTIARSPIVSSGGELWVYGSALKVSSATGAVVSKMTDTAVITYEDIVISSGGDVVISSGGTAYAVDVVSGGSLTVEGVVSGVTLSSGASLVIKGEAYDIFQEWGASVTAEEGATVTYISFMDGLEVSSGICITVPAKAIARGPIISSGGTMLVSGSALNVVCLTGGVVSAVAADALITYSGYSSSSN